jgi:hypothetical protein
MRQVPSRGRQGYYRTLESVPRLHQHHLLQNRRGRDEPLRLQPKQSSAAGGLQVLILPHIARRRVQLSILANPGQPHGLEPRGRAHLREPPPRRERSQENGETFLPERLQKTTQVIPRKHPLHRSLLLSSLHEDERANNTRDLVLLRPISPRPGDRPGRRDETIPTPKIAGSQKENARRSNPSGFL